MVPTRSLADYRDPGARRDTPTALAAAGPARHRAHHCGLAPTQAGHDAVLAPDLLITAKDPARWAPEDLLRTLVEAEIAARDASNSTGPG